STEPPRPENADANAPVARPQNKRLQQTQAQVDEVVDIMRVNMEKVLERDAKLSQLDDRADALQAGASQFEASAGKLKNKYWWKNMKMNIIIGAVVLVIVIALGWYIFGGKKNETRAAPAPLPSPGETASGTHIATAVAEHTPSGGTTKRRRRWAPVRDAPLRFVI
ncbi:Vesicle-associated membrane protein 2, partial [Fasciolopsis buskii]